MSDDIALVQLTREERCALWASAGSASEDVESLAYSVRNRARTIRRSAHYRLQHDHEAVIERVATLTARLALAEAVCEAAQEWREWRNRGTQSISAHEAGVDAWLDRWLADKEARHG